MVFNSKKKDSEDPADYVARKDYKKAVSLYRERVAKQPRNTNLRMSLADTLLLANQTDEAIPEYKELARLYTDDGFLVKAIAVYKKLLKLRPDDREIQQLLDHLSEKRQPTQAVKEEQAPAMIPETTAEEGVIEVGSDAIITETEADAAAAPLREVETRLFAGLSRDEFQDIVSRLKLHHYEEDTLVVQEGDPGDSLFIIVQGEVRVLTRDARQNEIVLANLGEGEFFGEVSLLTGKPRTATIMTNLSSELLELTREEYEQMVARFPHMRTVMEEFHQQRAYRTVEAMIQAFRQNP